MGREGWEREDGGGGGGHWGLLVHIHGDLKIVQPLLGFMGRGRCSRQLGYCTGNATDYDASLPPTHSVCVSVNSSVKAESPAERHDSKLVLGF